jgi:hypothetical protein
MRTIIAVALVATFIATPSAAAACGEDKPEQPAFCVPTAPPAAPAPAPVIAPVAVAPVAAPAAVAPQQSSGGSPTAEWCHYEPSTGQWEIRRAAMQTGDRAPIERGLCEQDRPAAPAVARSAPPVVAVAIEQVAAAPVVIEAAPVAIVAAAPVVIEAAPVAIVAAAPVEAEVLPLVVETPAEVQPEEEQPHVPVQIP